MDTVKSFKGYGKVDPIEEQAFRRKTRKRIIILIVSVVVLLTVIVAVAGTLIHKSKNNKVPAVNNSSADAIKAVCSQTLYPQSCYDSLYEVNKSNSTDPEELLKLSLQVVLTSLTDLAPVLQSLKKLTDENGKKALGVCEYVLNNAIEYVHDMVASMDVKPGEKLLTGYTIEDLKTWMSTVITDQDTCLDALQEMNVTLYEDMKLKMQNSTEYASNSLAIVTKISGILDKLNLPFHRKLLSETEHGFPHWVCPDVLKMLQANVLAPNVIVAANGSGDDVSTIKEALAKVTKESKSMFIIYVKEGVYKEHIVLNKSIWNVMIYGDGKDKSIVSGDLNVVDGIPHTYLTATFDVNGQGFVAMNMGFKNTAGAAKHQAVAFRSGSDYSVFYRCSFDAFQDTLYPYSNRQFYRECDIIGTIDFIFGNAAVVFQSCNIMPRQPLSKQSVTITAQGMTDKNQNTGISIINCNFSLFDKLTAPAYLGRPWKDYSTTVIMHSVIGEFLNPLGWIPWILGNKTYDPPPTSIFYGEYMNTGQGAGVDKRVNWAGYKPSLTQVQAKRFTVSEFIKGGANSPCPVI